MSRVQLELPQGAISVDAAVIAGDLRLNPACVLDLLRAGKLTARCEQGIAEDVDRFRLTFYHANRRLRLIIDHDGQILSRSVARLRRTSNLPEAGPGLCK
jgi:hypothetical protein